MTLTKKFRGWDTYKIKPGTVTEAAVDQIIVHAAAFGAAFEADGHAGTPEVEELAVAIANLETALHSAREL